MGHTLSPVDWYMRILEPLNPTFKISCSAIISNVVMATDNMKHLERLPNIVIESWTKR